MEPPLILPFGRLTIMLRSEVIPRTEHYLDHGCFNDRT
jgi:hypothetical protein